MAREEKEAVVSEIKEKMRRAKGAVLTDFRGLNTHELAELRRDLRNLGVEYKVYKNTLTKIAVNDIGLGELNTFLEGPTAIAFSYDDAIAAAKQLSGFSRQHQNLTLKAGVVEGKIVDGKGVQAIAMLPPRDVLLAQAVGMMQAPIVNLAGVLQGPVRALAVALGQIAQQKTA